MNSSLLVFARELVLVHQLRFAAEVRRVYVEERRVREGLPFGQCSVEGQYRRAALRSVRVLVDVETVKRNDLRRAFTRLNRFVEQLLRASELEAAHELHSVQEGSLRVARLRFLSRKTVSWVGRNVLEAVCLLLSNGHRFVRRSCTKEKIQILTLI